MLAMRAWVTGAVVAGVLVHASAFAQDAVPATDAAACGEAAFAEAEVEARAFDDLEIAIPPGLTEPETIDRYLSELRAASERAAAAASRYEAVIRCRSGFWSSAAYARQGQIYETLARASRRSLPVVGRDRARAAVDVQTRPIDCLAVVRYVLVVRAARAGGFRTALTRAVLDALVRYPFAEAASCVVEQRTRDASFAPLTLADMAPYR